MAAPLTPLAANLVWRDGKVPVSTRFDDPYYAVNDGLGESRHVFLQGNRLAARLRPGFRVAELGFGTGLNMLALSGMVSAMDLPGPVLCTSFEAFPMAAADMARALAAFPDIADTAGRLVSQWAAGTDPIILPGLVLTVVPGDARVTLPAWPHKADAWFLDGFAPARNPELWEPALLAEVGRHTAPGGTVATYSAAGAVRRALDAAGFDVTRAPGFGAKRHMVTAVLR